MWDTTITLQPKIFLYSIILGILISIYFDLFKSVRQLCDFSELQVFFQDIAFFLVVTPCVFMFLQSFTYGELRGFVFIGLILGFLMWRFTLSRYFVYLLVFVFGFFIKSFSYLSGKISHFFDSLILFSTQKIKKFLKMVKKAVFSLKKS